MKRAVMTTIGLLFAFTLAACSAGPPLTDVGPPPHDYEQKATAAVAATLGRLVERTTFVSCAAPKRAYLPKYPLIPTGPLTIIWDGYEVAVTYRVKNYVGYSNTDVTHVMFIGENVSGLISEGWGGLQWYKQ